MAWSTKNRHDPSKNEIVREAEDTVTSALEELRAAVARMRETKAKTTKLREST